MPKQYDKDTLLGIQRRSPAPNASLCHLLNDLGIYHDPSDLQCSSRKDSTAPRENRSTPMPVAAHDQGLRGRGMRFPTFRDEDPSPFPQRGRVLPSPRGVGSSRSRGGRGGPLAGTGLSRCKFQTSNTFDIDRFSRLDDPDDVALQLAGSTQRLEAFLESPFLQPKDSVKLLRVLTEVTKSELHRESATKILQVLGRSQYLDTHLPALINKFKSSGNRSPPDVGATVTEVVDMILQLVSETSHRLPSLASKGSLLLTFLESAAEVMSAARTSNPSLDEVFKDLMEKCQQRMEMVQSMSRQKHLAKRRVLNGDEEVPPEDFATLPILPERRDMDWTEKPFLRANKKKGAFNDQDHYLDVQFRLLREDYIRPLRNGIKEFQRLREKGETPKKCQDLRYYYRVRIVEPLCGETLQHRLQFDNTRLKYVKWRTSKRLQYGSLVCLSMDDFETVLFAVVTSREVDDLKKGIVTVTFENCLEEILEMSPNDLFTMAETTSFFEASRHVLEGLQEMKTNVPLMRYIVECHMDVKPPNYLYASGPTKMNLRSLLREDSGFDAQAVSVLNPRSWPSLQETGFNESQLEALQTALTKELALIKGPPGTGKTYVGLKIVQVLLDNMDVWNQEDGQRPILIVCYTNHALDQFLEGILQFCKNGLVRVGSRCKNEKLEPFNLSKIRRTVLPKGYITDFNEDTLALSEKSRRRCFNEMRTLGASVEEKSCLKEAVSKGVFNEYYLEESMLPGQYESLTSKQRVDVIMDWLAFGSVIQSHDENSDPYMVLAKEVTAQILSGTDSPERTVISTENVNTVPPKVRAQRYRTWLKRASKSDQQKGQENHEDRQTETEILADDMLKSGMEAGELPAIRSAVLNNQDKEGQYCIRAWLGVGELSEDVMSQITGFGNDTFSDESIDPESVLRISRKTRFRLYRLWMRKTEVHLNNCIAEDKRKRRRVKRVHVRSLKLLQKQIISDKVLQPFVKKELFSAITEAMKEKLEVQSRYCIRTWLGIQEFNQNPQALEKVLEQLSEKKERAMPATTEKEFVEGEDEAPEESERQLDDGDDEERLIRDETRRNLWNKLIPLQIEDFKPDQNQLLTRWPVLSLWAGYRWAIPLYIWKVQLKKLQRLLQTAKPMSKEEASSVENLWDPQLTIEDRVRLYLFWVETHRSKLKADVQKEAEEFVQESKRYQELKMAVDCEILKKAKVVGMTTTGAARYRKVLAKVGCPIVLIEEAAEVFEAHVVTTINESCQHLILIGDHQQLRPSPTVYELCRHYQLDVSLFERLVNNHLHHSTLAVQHRMRPEIARLVRHVYPELQDHPTTQNRPQIRGLKENIFLFHHEVSETVHEETSSKSNKHEAELCVGLCSYLLYQGYDPSSITILTAYTGQVLVFQSMMPVRGVRVTSVDNYQGEENDVIILSLVRSNEKGSVGFLGTDNRICVAISRAKAGFYAFGNFRMLAERSVLWRKIVENAKESEQIGEALILQCANHPDIQYRITCAEDFKKVPEGVCQLPCGARLNCGHLCPKHCHSIDPDHKEDKCKKKCERQCERQLHTCPKKCFESCGDCTVLMENMVPACGHKQMMPCHAAPETWPCQKKCEQILRCGHQCGQSCAECRVNHSDKCTVNVSMALPCGHRAKVSCHQVGDKQICKEPCKAKLDCGHICPGACSSCLGGRVHVECVARCERVLEGCGHSCPVQCAKPCQPCKETCRTPCTHGHCEHPCQEPCTPCEESCPWKCEHKPCSGTCDDPCEPCVLKCRKKLPCGHLCTGSCRENCFCFFCEKKEFIQLSLEGVVNKERSNEVVIDRSVPLMKLPTCGHIFRREELDSYIQRKMQSPTLYSKLTCPACPASLREYHCWRYNRRLHQHYNAQQDAKQKLADSLEFISSERMMKFRQSRLIMPTEASRKGVFNNLSIYEENKPDKAFALTNQRKLVSVAHHVKDLLQSLDPSRTDPRMIKMRAIVLDDVEILEGVLFEKLPVLSRRRCRELTEETRRLLYMAQLCYAVSLSSGNMDRVQQIDSCFEQLRGKTSHHFPSSEMLDVFQQCRQQYPEWQSKVLNTACPGILDAPYDMELCDIKSAAAAFATNITHNQASVRV